MSGAGFLRPVLSAALLGLVLATPVRAQHQSSGEGPLASFNELQPPTPEDWLRYRFAERMKDGCSCTVEPIPLTPVIHYFPHQPCDCGPGHISYRGRYGIFRPMPYYIEMPRITPAGVPWHVRSPEHPSLRVLPEPPVETGPVPLGE
jgi:hypothetical protein